MADPTHLEAALVELSRAGHERFLLEDGEGGVALLVLHVDRSFRSKAASFSLAAYLTEVPIGSWTPPQHELLRARGWEYVASPTHADAVRELWCAPSAPSETDLVAALRALLEALTICYPAAALRLLPG